MVSYLIERKMTVKEFEVLGKKVLEEKGQITIKDHRGMDSKAIPYLDLSIEVIDCFASLNSIRFSVNDGKRSYMDIKFDDTSGSESELDIQFEFNSKGYCVHFGTLFIVYDIKPYRFEYILNNIKCSVDKVRQEEYKALVLVNWNKGKTQSEFI